MEFIKEWINDEHILAVKMMEIFNISCDERVVLRDK